MNPKHFHTPVSTRLRCPVCHQPVYSRGGIHPQCAMRQSEPALHEPEEPVEIIAEDQKRRVWLSPRRPCRTSELPRCSPRPRPSGAKAVR